MTAKKKERPSEGAALEAVKNATREVAQAQVELEAATTHYEACAAVLRKKKSALAKARKALNEALR